MSSITKQQLKSVVKECLLEILSEGVGSSLNESLKRKDDNSSVHRRSPALDRTVVSSQKRTITYKSRSWREPCSCGDTF
jgi:hypothetical protein